MALKNGSSNIKIHRIQAGINLGVKLITGPAGSGKTEACIVQLCTANPVTWHSGFRYIVPTTQIARQVETRLMDRAGVSGILGNVVCTFFSFAQEFINSQGLASRLITDIQKDLLLDDLVRHLRLGYFRRSAEYPGFASSLDTIIGELKTSLIDPQNLRNALVASRGQLPPESYTKIDELTRIYEQYQENILIKCNLHDREGVMWRALEIAADTDSLSKIKCVVFDGFSEFNGVQREFLSVIAAHVPNVLVTLPYESNRYEVFGPMEADRSFVLNLPDASEISLQRPAGESSALRVLEAGIFSKPSECVEPDSSVTEIVAGNRSIEVELVAEQIKHLIQDKSLSYSDIALTGRDINSYRTCLDRVFGEYGIPLEPGERPASGLACISLLKACCEVVLNGWKRDDVFKIMHSELLTSDLQSSCRAQVDARQLGITQGRENWLKSWGDEDTTNEFRKNIHASVTVFEDSLKNALTLEGYVDSVRVLILSFKRETSSDETMLEDAAALKLVEQVLGDLLDALAFVGNEPKVEVFLPLLQNALNRSKCTVPHKNQDCVSVVDVGSMSGQRYEIVFVLGLLERVFPRQAREDSFLRDSERSILNQNLNGKLTMRLSQKNRERTLFYSTIGAARKRLYLCYPLSDESAKDSLPSFFMDEVRKLYNQKLISVKRDISDTLPGISDSQTRISLLRSLVYRLSHVSADEQSIVASIYNIIVQTGELSGVFRDCKERDACLQDERIVSLLSEKYRTFRCTELETYAACPFMHFCQSTLGLEPIREQVGGLDTGSILHKVLYRLFTGLREKMGDELRVDKLNADSTVNSALEILSEEFKESPRMQHLPEHQAAMLLKNLSGYLKRCIIGDINSKRENYCPTYFELEFGNKAKPDRPRDPESSDKPLVIRSEDGDTAALCGKIDRVDVSSKGAMVIDYKLGSSISMLGFEKELTLQAMIYAIAMNDLFGFSPVGAEYRPLKKWAPEGYYATSSGVSKRNRTVDDQAFAAKLDLCKKIVLGIAQNIRLGRIATEPKDCKSYCSFKGICRIDDYKLMKLKENGPQAEEAEL